MEEIKVNDYVKLDRNQGIRKIVEIEDDCYYLDEEIADEWGETAYAIGKEDLDEEVLKHSENILDLIEIGDILEIEEDGIRGCIGWNKDTTTLSYKDMIEDIKKGDVKLLGIVTHEQFNSIKYEVE